MVPASGAFRATSIGIRLLLSPALVLGFFSCIVLIRLPAGLGTQKRPEYQREPLGKYSQCSGLPRWKPLPMT